MTGIKTQSRGFCTVNENDQDVHKSGDQALESKLLATREIY